MARFLLRIEYVGTRYRGWQIQENARTIQGDIAEAVGLVTGTSDFELYGSGRTDAGVHALLQVAHLDVDTTIPPEKLRQDLNDSLPPDINILSLDRVARDFHARHGAIGRSYVYQIARRRTAFGKPFVWWVRDRLDVTSMREAAQTFVGFHDFRGFTAVDPDEVSTKVKLEAFDVVEADDLILVRIRGSHFLWKMVRRLVGVLVEVGRGHLTPEAAKNLLDNPAGLPAELTAPPSGLYLEQVIYEGESFDRPLAPAFAVTSVPVGRRFAPAPSWKVDEDVSTGEREATPRQPRPAGPRDDRTRRYVPGRRPASGAGRGRRSDSGDAASETGPSRPGSRSDEGERTERKPYPKRPFEGSASRYVKRSDDQSHGRSSGRDSAETPDGAGRGAAGTERGGYGTGGEGYRKPYAKKPFGERGGAERASRDTGGDTYRKPYARRPYGEGKAEGAGRGTSGDTYRKPYVKKPYGEGQAEGSGRGTSGATYRKPYAKKPYGEGQAEGSGRGTSGATYRKPYAKKPYGEGKAEGSGRGASGNTYRKPYAKKPYGEGKAEGSGRATSGDTYSKPYVKKPYGEGKAEGSGRGTSGDTYRKPYAKKPYGERSSTEGSARGAGGGAARKPYGKKPFGAGGSRGGTGVGRRSDGHGPKRRT